MSPPLHAEVSVPKRTFDHLEADIKKLFLAWQQDLGAYAEWWQSEEPAEMDLPHWYNERTEWLLELGIVEAKRVPGEKR
jgi:hypothetical protein